MSVVNTPNADFNQSTSFCAAGCAKSMVLIVQKRLESVIELPIQFIDTRQLLLTRSVPFTIQMCPRVARTRIQRLREIEKIRTANGSHVD